MVIVTGDCYVLRHAAPSLHYCYGLIFIVDCSQPPLPLLLHRAANKRTNMPSEATHSPRISRHRDLYKRLQVSSLSTSTRAFSTPTLVHMIVASTGMTPSLVDCHSSSLSHHRFRYNADIAGQELRHGPNDVVPIVHIATAPTGVAPTVISFMTRCFICILFIVSGSTITTLILFLPYLNGKANKPHGCFVSPANDDMSEAHSIENSSSGMVEARVLLMAMMLIKTTTTNITTRMASWEKQSVDLEATILMTFPTSFLMTKYTLMRMTWWEFGKSRV